MKKTPNTSACTHLAALMLLAAAFAWGSSTASYVPFSRSHASISTPLFELEVDTFGVFCINDTATCADSVLISFRINSDCPEGLQSISLSINEQTDTLALSGTFPDYQICGVFEAGDYPFVVEATDGCGNTLQYSDTFALADCAPPAVFWNLGAVLDIEPITPQDMDGDGDLEYIGGAIDASVFIADSVYDCTTPLSYSIYFLNEVLDSTVIPSPGHPSLWVECEHSLILVRIFVWDSANNPYSLQPDGSLGGPNYSYDDSYILVNASFYEKCFEPNPGSSIGGSITVECAGNEALHGVDVYLSGNGSFSTISSSTGYFFPFQLPGEYTITPELDEDPLNGVSTFDIILLTKHILGVYPLDSPYELIAADVNNSHTITTQDAIAIRKLILHQTIEFANNTSWRFVPASYEFPDPDNPWLEAFPESITVAFQTCCLSEQNFFAIKIGDMNCNTIND